MTLSLFTDPHMPRQVGYYHAWHNDYVCDFNRYRYVVIKVIMLDGQLKGVCPFQRPWAEGCDAIIEWGPKIEIPDPPQRLLEKDPSGQYQYNNITQFVWGKHLKEFERETGDIPVGSNCSVKVEQK